MFPKRIKQVKEEPVGECLNSENEVPTPVAQVSSRINYQLLFFIIIICVKYLKMNPSILWIKERHKKFVGVKDKLKDIISSKQVYPISSLYEFLSVSMKDSNDHLL